MITDHDQDMLLRCRRLGHEIHFGYCRQESRGKPCRLIADCWWEQFDVKAFFAANLTPEALAELAQSAASAPQAKMVSLFDLIQNAQERVGAQATAVELSKPEQK